MRLNKLILHAFGQFSEKAFDFGEKRQGKSDFHIFYGRNEAGKTTLMEAWLRLLFGIPLKNEKYAFKHKRKNLKLSAVLEHDDKTYSLRRLPQGSGSILLDKNGQNADLVIRDFLGDLHDEQHYRNLLCLDDAVIEQGGQDIMESKGKMDNLLFSAMSGLTNFSKLLENSKARIDALYRPRAQNTELAELKRQYTELKEKITEADISASRYRELQEQVDLAGKTEQSLQKQRRAAAETTNILNSVLEKRRRYQELQRQFTDTTEQLTEKLASLGLQENLLQADNTEELYRKLSVFAVSASQIENLRQARAEIRSWAEKQAETEKQLEQKAQKLTESEQVLAQLRQNLPAQEDYQKLCSALENFQASELKQSYRAAQEKQDTARQRALNALTELTTIQGERFTALPASSVSPRDAERLAHERQTAQAEQKSAQEQERFCLSELSRVKEQLANLESEAGLR